MKLAPALLIVCLALVSGSLLAQGRGPGGGGGGMGGQRGGGGMMPGGGFPGGRDAARDMRGGMPPAGGGPAGSTSTMRGGLQLGPPGRWWDDKGFARSLGLRKEQQQRMDTVFNSNKGAILENYRNLQAMESRLESATHEAKLDEQKIFAAIDAVNQARSALEKANAHMLLMVRQEMEADQVNRMEKFRDRPADE